MAEVTAKDFDYLRGSKTGYAGRKQNSLRINKLLKSVLPIVWIRYRVTWLTGKNCNSGSFEQYP